MAEADIVYPLRLLLDATAKRSINPELQFSGGAASPSTVIPCAITIPDCIAVRFVTIEHNCQDVVIFLVEAIEQIPSLFFPASGKILLKLLASCIIWFHAYMISEN